FVPQHGNSTPVDRPCRAFTCFFVRGVGRRLQPSRRPILRARAHRHNRKASDFIVGIPLRRCPPLARSETSCESRLTRLETADDRRVVHCPSAPLSLPTRERAFG